MSITRRAFIIVGAGASLSACASFGLGTNVPAGTTTPAELNQASILAAINEARRINGGHKPLTYNVALETAARSQADADGQSRISCRTISASPCASASPPPAITARWAKTSPAARRRWSRRSRAGSIRPATARLCSATNSSSSASPRRRSAAGPQEPIRHYWCFIAGGPFEAWLTASYGQRPLHRIAASPLSLPCDVGSPSSD